MKINEIQQKAISIRDYLKSSYDFNENPIDQDLLPVIPYKTSNNIQLIIIGQDPTIRKEDRRILIETVLNLDKSGALKNYIETLCCELKIDIASIYATNLYKYFYSKPPADTFEILLKHRDPNLKLLIGEIRSYDKIPIITLGEPILRILMKESYPSEMKYYWDYDKQKKQSNMEFKYCEKEMNLLNRDFFPFPHQPSMGKQFYKKTLKDYLNFMKKITS